MQRLHNETNISSFRTYFIPHIEENSFQWDYEPLNLVSVFYETSVEDKILKTKDHFERKIATKLKMKLIAIFGEKLLIDFRLIELIAILLACVVLFITVIKCQKSEKPNINCDDMKAQSGKDYHELYVPHESNCNHFYQCTDHGLVELNCHQKLVFFPYINGCVERTSQNCITWNQWRSLSN